jgi:hypothetical protein
MKTETLYIIIAAIVVIGIVIIISKPSLKLNEEIVL